MPVLLLNRQCTVAEWEPDSAAVVCEPRARVSAGWCARIGPNPGDPYGLWARDFLRAAPEDLGGRTVHVFDDLPPGLYEAHSTLTSRGALVVFFEVTAGGTIEIVGGQGDEDMLIAVFNDMTLDELHDARESASHRHDLPRLEGSIKQTAWAERIRDDQIQAADVAGDLGLADQLRKVRDATWFIANRDRTLDALRARLGTPV